MQDIELGARIIRIQELNEGDVIEGILQGIKDLGLSQGLLLKKNDGSTVILPITATMVTVDWEKYMGWKLRFTVMFTKTSRGKAFLPRVQGEPPPNKSTDEESVDVPF